MIPLEVTHQNIATQDVFDHFGTLLNQYSIHSF